MPIKKFVDHMKMRNHWVAQVLSNKSPFMRLMEMGDLFLQLRSDMPTNPNTFVSSFSISNFDKSYLPTAEIDLFNLQIFALLVCRGGIRYKAEILYDLV